MSLFDLRLHTIRNQELFLNLLFKSLKADSHQARVMAFVKRFCQVLVSGFGSSEFVGGGLWLLGEVRYLRSTGHGITHPTVQAIQRIARLTFANRRSPFVGCRGGGVSTTRISTNRNMHRHNRLLFGS